MRKRNLTPPRKKLTPLAKVKLAATVFVAASAGQLDEKEAGQILRNATGAQWSLLTCVQYLSGKEALREIVALPVDWSEDGLNKPMLETAAKLAALAVATAHPDGKPLCASEFAQQFKQHDSERNRV